jgi:hypothetical protein
MLASIDLHDDAFCVTSKIGDVSPNTNLATENECPAWEACDAGATIASVLLRSARHAWHARADVAAAPSRDPAWPRFAAHPVWTCLGFPTRTPTPNPSPQGGGEHTEPVVPLRINSTRIRFRPGRGLLSAPDKIQGVSDLPSRKPRMTSRPPTVPARRRPARRSRASLAQEPPRTTRRLQSPDVQAEPSEGAPR